MIFERYSQNLKVQKNLDFQFLGNFGFVVQKRLKVHLAKILLIRSRLTAIMNVLISNGQDLTGNGMFLASICTILQFSQKNNLLSTGFAAAIFFSFWSWCFARTASLSSCWTVQNPFTRSSSYKGRGKQEWFRLVSYTFGIRITSTFVIQYLNGPNLFRWGLLLDFECHLNTEQLSSGGDKVEWSLSLLL